MFIRDTIAAIDGLALAEEECAKIYFRNALSMLKMPAA
jgi:hypothetical protein